MVGKTIMLNLADDGKQCLELVGVNPLQAQNDEVRICTHEMCTRRKMVLDS